MATEYRLSYTASEIDRRLGKIDDLAEKSELPLKLSDLDNDRDFATKDDVKSYAQPIGEYALKSDIPEVPVQSVNGKTGNINLMAADVHALPDTTKIPANLADLIDDVGHRTVSDEEKSIWNAKSSFSGNYNDLVGKPSIPSIDGLASVTYVNSQDEEVVKNVTAYVDEKIAEIPTPDVSSQINEHNTSNTAHNDIRETIEEVRELASNLSVPTTLSELNDDENHRTVTDAEKADWNAKVDASDIVDNLITDDSNKPLSATQGVVLKSLVDELYADKIDASKLTDAVNDALEQAKESGEFDGMSATHSWDGTILTINSASGASSVDLQGEKGDAFTYADFTDDQLAALKGEPGNPGVYLGSGDMPEDCNVQIDPNGDILTIDDIVQAVLAALPTYDASTTKGEL